MSSREDRALWRGSLFCTFFHNAPVLNIQVLMERKLPLFIASCLPSKPLILCCVSLILSRIYRCRAWGSPRLVTSPLSQEKRRNFHLWDYRPSRTERISHKKSQAPMTCNGRMEATFAIKNSYLEVIKWAQGPTSLSQYLHLPNLAEFLIS